MTDAIPLWLHILGATLWVGPQFSLALAGVPAVRAISDDAVRAQALRRLTSRVGMVTGAGLLILILTGIDNIIRRAPDDLFDLRYGPILVAKLVLVALTLVATVYHAAIIGPRLLRATEAGDQAAVRRLRVRSLAASMLTLVLALVILYLATLLRLPFAYHSI